jgi:hypothetical protein
VKVTVIATGFQPHTETVVELPARPAPVFVAEPIAALPPLPEPMPAPVIEAEPEPAFDPEDLDTPAYLRQGRLLN